MTKKRDRDDFTPMEAMMLCGFPVVAIMEQVLADAKSDPPQVNQHGLYVANQPKVIVPGAEPSYNLVGIKIPLPVALEFAKAYVQARETPFGKQLEEKAAKFAREAKEALTSGEAEH